MNVIESSHNETKLNTPHLTDNQDETAAETNAGHSSTRGLRIKSSVKAGSVPDAPERR
jgi:hypothetical protein